MTFGLRISSLVLASVVLVPAMGFAQLPDCSASGLPSYATLTTTLQAVVGAKNIRIAFPRM